MLIADPGWIKKSALLSLALAVPSFILLVKVWRDRSQRPKSTSSATLAIWAGLVFLATYVAWFVNVTFEKSVMFMVAWPLIGILLALLGCGISLAVGGEDRKKLFIANALLLILAVASIIAPN
jgi:hypothetical protein